MTLSDSQKEVLDNLRNGWKLHSTETRAAMKSPEGKTVKVSLTTVLSLFNMGLIKFERDNDRRVDVWRAA